MFIYILQKASFKKAGSKLKINLTQPLWKAVWRFIQKLKAELPYIPAIPLLEYTKTPQNTNL